MMVKNINLTEAEEKLAALIWREAPLTSPDLVSLAQREMDWKKSTTYTVLKKLCDKGVFKNENASVSVLLMAVIWCCLFINEIKIYMTINGTVKHYAQIGLRPVVLTVS